MEQLRLNYSACNLCPHECGVDRTQGEFGICGELAAVRVASVGLHQGEEPALITKQGSGTIFFTGCSLHCQHCQNMEISQSQSPLGVTHSIEELAQVFLYLQRKGAANVNLVTPTHFAPSLIETIKVAQAQGFRLPVVYNTSGYEKVEALREVDPYLDTYLLDIKTLDYTVAAEFCGSRDYPDVVQKIIPFLKQRHPKTYLDASGFIRGVLVRHLIFPQQLAATKEFLTWFASTLKDHAWLSLLFHFVYPQEGRRFATLSSKEYQDLIDFIRELGIRNGYIQGLRFGSHTLSELY